MQLKFHSFSSTVSEKELPDEFTFPFNYSPHPLCIIAAEQVKKYLESRSAWHEELEKGKMFGVLIVQKQDGEIGFIAAFSGNIAHSNNHNYFVPPIYDLLNPKGFFRIEEDNISAINRQIVKCQNDARFKQLTEGLLNQKLQADIEMADARINFKEAKRKREIRRSENPNESEIAEMIRESQFQKAELKRMEKAHKEIIADYEQSLKPFNEKIEQLKQERKKRSADLQNKLFDYFCFLNARGEEKKLPAIFITTPQKTPPAGAGECAAPKLLQYAYCKGLRPIAMAEFWWGNSPKTEIRHHGNFYPACKSKCEPILSYMLQGLNVEKDPLLKNTVSTSNIEILYEDEWIVCIDKPANILTVPGKTDLLSVYDWAKERYPDATGPLIVHRLDMATSGILIIAKTKEAHKKLQREFKERNIKKRYTAILAGNISGKDGMIELPLCLNPDDRPRQIVCRKYGKPAVTRFEVLETKKGLTKVAFYPITGRTHQLRVHAAHPEGLNTPIKGDTLYGKPDSRLFLHAESIEFAHPLTGKTIHIEHKNPDFDL